MPDSIHSGHRERIREQYKTHGADAFLDHQFLELLLTYAIPRRDTNELAHQLLSRFGSLEGVVTAEIAQLMLVDGIGERQELLPDRVLVYAHDGEAALAAAHARGLQPESALVRRSSLEDVFLLLTGRTLAD